MPSRFALHLVIVIGFVLGLVGVSPAAPAMAATGVQVSIENPGGMARDLNPDVAQDPKNPSILTAAWVFDYDVENKNGRIRVSRSTDGGNTWSPEAEIYQGTFGHYLESPRLAYDSNGNLHLVFWAGLGTGRKIYYRYVAAGANTGVAGNWQNGGNPCTNCVTPDLTADNKGNVYLAYESPDNYIGVLRRPGLSGGWGALQKVSFGKRIRGAIAVTPDDKIHVTMYNVDQDIAQYARYTSYTNFTQETLTQISDGTFQSQTDITSDASGVVHMVWKDEDRYWHRQYANGSLSGATAISLGQSGSNSFGYLTVEADSNGNVYVAWPTNVSGATNAQINEVQRQNGVWQTRQNLAGSSSERARYPKYGQSLLGAVNLIFVQADITRFLSRTGGGSSDSTPPVVTGATAPGSSSNQRIPVTVTATDPNGGQDETVSGLARYEYSLDGANWVLGEQTSSGGANFNVDLANPTAGGSWASGTRTVYFRVVDAAGNVSSAPITARNLNFQPGEVTARYAAEGFTGSGFDMYATVANPGANPIHVTIRFQYANGDSGPAGTLITIAPGQRQTVKINDLAGANKSLSLKFESNADFFAERPMYFSNYAGKGIDGGHVAAATDAAPDWYFAEGYTGGGFDGYFTILNPGATQANITITYYFPGGGSTARNLSINPGVRATVSIHDPVSPGNPGGLGRNQTFSAKVSGNGKDIVVERVQYFSYGDGWTGGTATLGATSPNTTWYFAEGWTGVGFDQYVTIQNPGAAGSATLTYFTNGGGVHNRVVPLAANSRTTVNVHDLASGGNPGGLGRGYENSLKIVSTVPVVAERPMYFNYNGGPGMDNVDGGHNAMGATSTIKQGETVFFAEGTTRPGFHQYLTFQNPNSGTATVEITYLRGSGSPELRTLTIPGNQRRTVIVHATASGSNPGGFGAGNTDAFDIATKVEVKGAGGEGVLVERPMYFKYKGAVTGGHDAMPMRFE